VQIRDDEAGKGHPLRKNSDDLGLERKATAASGRPFSEVNSLLPGLLAADPAACNVPRA
jgi:hypothetical protein